MISDIAISIGGVEDVPRRFIECEDVLRGSKYDIDEVKKQIIGPLDQINYIDDSLVTGSYRQKLLKGLLVRSIEQAASRSKFFVNREMLNARTRCSNACKWQTVSGKVETRTHLGDFLRQAAGLTGTHLGCEHGVCGACTVIVDGDAVRSCLMLAVQADNCEVITIEGIARRMGFASSAGGFS